LHEYCGVGIMTDIKKKVAFHTLGCKLNFAETSTISRSFPEDQFEKVPANTKADIYVINTCSVTDSADRKCRQTIKKFIGQAPEAVIAVVGCYAQLNPGEISEIDGVDLVLGNNEKFNIAAYLREFEKKGKAEIHSCNGSGLDRFYPSYSMGDRTRSFLKVQDGCDYGCSYCTIPLARGQSRNQEIGILIGEAENIASRGIKEIVLTGVNIGDFGKSTDDTFTGLLKELVKVDGIERYRISSIEPNLITVELIEMTALNRKILPHFHIPLQSGSDKILGLMQRRYRRELFKDKLFLIKEQIPLPGIGADVIVGFPGETDNDFEETFSFLAEMPVTYLHVFTFSERPGTLAAGMANKVPVSTRNKRSKKLIALSEEKHHRFLEMNMWKSANVLFEQTRVEGMITGFSDNYIRVEHQWDPELCGKIRKVTLTGISGTGKMSVEFTD